MTCFSEMLRCRVARRTSRPAGPAHDKLTVMSTFPPPTPGLRVWDLPTRLFHVAFALTVAGAIAALAATGAWWLLTLVQA